MGDAHKCVCTAYRARRTHALFRICVHREMEIARDRIWKVQPTPAAPHTTPRPPSLSARIDHRKHLRPRAARERAVSNMCGGRRGVNGRPRQCSTYLRARDGTAELHHLLRTRSEARTPPSIPSSCDAQAWHLMRARESGAGADLHTAAPHCTTRRHPE